LTTRESANPGANPRARVGKNSPDASETPRTVIDAGEPAGADLPPEGENPRPARESEPKALSKIAAIFRVSVFSRRGDAAGEKGKPPAGKGGAASEQSPAPPPKSNFTVKPGVTVRGSAAVIDAGVIAPEAIRRPKPVAGQAFPSALASPAAKGSGVSGAPPLPAASGLRGAAASENEKKPGAPKVRFPAAASAKPAGKPKGNFPFPTPPATVETDKPKGGLKEIFVSSLILLVILFVAGVGVRKIIRGESAAKLEAGDTIGLFGENPVSSVIGGEFETPGLNSDDDSDDVSVPGIGLAGSASETSGSPAETPKTAPLFEVSGHTVFRENPVRSPAVAPESPMSAAGKKVGDAAENPESGGTSPGFVPENTRDPGDPNSAKVSGAKADSRKDPNQIVRVVPIIPLKETKAGKSDGTPVPENAPTVATAATSASDAPGNPDGIDFRPPDPFNPATGAATAAENGNPEKTAGGFPPVNATKIDIDPEFFGALPAAATARTADQTAGPTKADAENPGSAVGAGPAEKDAAAGNPENAKNPGGAAGKVADGKPAAAGTATATVARDHPPAAGEAIDGPGNAGSKGLADEGRAIVEEDLLEAEKMSRGGEAKPVTGFPAVESTILPNPASPANAMNAANAAKAPNDTGAKANVSPETTPASAVSRDGARDEPGGESGGPSRGNPPVNGAAAVFAGPDQTSFSPVSVVVGKLGRGPHNPLKRTELAELLGKGARVIDAENGILAFSGPDDEVLYAKTTLDAKLQNEVLKMVKTGGGLNVALVAMDPSDGRILAMAGVNGTDPLDHNPALSGHVPAASVFKLVTAAAAMERNAYTRESTVLYDGGKHTLHKGNVVKEPDVGVHKASLEQGFADSINSVFGKLGIYTMLPEEFLAYGEKMGFNKEIPFDLPVGRSEFLLTDPEDPFVLAELASGFNKTTTVSPLHAALLVSSVANGGVMPSPWFVSEVADGDANPLYRGGPSNLGSVMSPATAEELKALMAATILQGTGKKEFKDALTHPVLKKLEIGGKSGTINDAKGNSVEWFVAGASLKGKTGAAAKPVAIAAVVVHDGRTRATPKEMTRKVLLSLYGPANSKTTPPA
jgi:hypothetical protein